MKKRILFGSILAVFMLLVISFVTVAITEKTIEKKEPPLFRFRTNNAIMEGFKELRGNIITRFVQGRLVFSMPELGKEFSIREQIGLKTSRDIARCEPCTDDDYSCQGGSCNTVFTDVANTCCPFGITICGQRTCMYTQCKSKPKDLFYWMDI